MTLIIVFSGKKIEKLCCDSRLAQKKLGLVGARRLRQRLDDLDAAERLADFRSLPGRCHELQGDRKGQLSLDLDHPYRLIFEPADDPPEIREDGGLDWHGIRAVRILEVEDTHG